MYDRFVDTVIIEIMGGGQSYLNKKIVIMFAKQWSKQIYQHK